MLAAEFAESRFAESRFAESGFAEYSGGNLVQSGPLLKLSWQTGQ